MVYEHNAEENGSYDLNYLGFKAQGYHHSNGESDGKENVS